MHDRRRSHQPLLTRYGGRHGEALQYLRIDVDAKLLLLHQPLVPPLDDVVRPVGEGLPHDGVGQVDEPLPRQLAELLLVWQVLGAGLVARRLLQDLLDAEALVLGQGQVPDAVGVHELLGALNEGTQVVDGVVLVGGQVRVALDGQEGIAT